jgi:hypothetical protein
MGMHTGMLFWMVFTNSHKIKHMHMLCDPMILFLRVYSWEIKTHAHRLVSELVFITLFKVAQSGYNLNIHLVDR